MFGTDFPVVPYDVARTEMTALGLDPAIARKLENENAVKLYQLDTKK
jgi:predicted TIM-barrel fold metal-dependent hydrolase